jgi:hypothetical protein
VKTVLKKKKKKKKEKKRKQVKDTLDIQLKFLKAIGCCFRHMMQPWSKVASHMHYVHNESCQKSFIE